MRHTLHKKTLPFIGMIIAACLCYPAGLSADVTLLAVPENTRPPVDGLISVKLYIINPDSQSVSFTPPPQLTATLTRLSRPENTALPVTLRPETDKKQQMSFQLGAGAFRILPYQFRLPESLKAAVNLLLELDLPEGGTYIALVRIPRHQKVKAQQSAADDKIPETGHVTTEEAVPFLANFSGYEPTYFLYGADPANAKFQISFKYRFVNPEGDLAQRLPWFSRFHLGYTQTAFWDLSALSRPFTDTVFQPSFFYQYDLKNPKSLPSASHLKVTAGLQHQSNGKDGIDSRSLNLWYIEPEITFPLGQELELNLRARGWLYFGDLSDNPDIGDFRGNGLVSVGFGNPKGMMLTSEFRGNPGTGKGNLQIDLSYPLNRILFRNLDLYIFGQIYSGYGESLINYNRKDTRLRFGIALQR